MRNIRANGGERGRQKDQSQGRSLNGNEVLKTKKERGSSRGYQRNSEKAGQLGNSLIHGRTLLKAKFNGRGNSPRAQGIENKDGVILFRPWIK